MNELSSDGYIFSRILYAILGKIVPKKSTTGTEILTDFLADSTKGSLSAVSVVPLAVSIEVCGSTILSTTSVIGFTASEETEKAIFFIDVMNLYNTVM